MPIQSIFAHLLMEIAYRTLYQYQFGKSIQIILSINSIYNFQMAMQMLQYHYHMYLGLN